jgi:hypothetical protein
MNPLFVVCEDGDEYTQRFQKFLGVRFRFQRALDGRSAQQALQAGAVAGLLLDLDFRRTPPELLLGEAGVPPHPPSPDERARWSASQGILVLQYVRGQGLQVPALLFADLDDREQVAFLESSLAPLSIVSSREGLAQIAARLQALAEGRQFP